MRVLVTGSRAWDDRETIYKALAEVCWIADSPIILIHGRCPIGADATADYFARAFGWQVNSYPANWEKYGKRAGIVRNIEMVRAGADVCLAFIKDDSRGATHCADAAERAGIPTRRYYA